MNVVSGQFVLRHIPESVKDTISATTTSLSWLSCDINMSFGLTGQSLTCVEKPSWYNWNSSGCFLKSESAVLEWVVYSCSLIHLNWLPFSLSLIFDCSVVSLPLAASFGVKLVFDDGLETFFGAITFLFFDVVVVAVNAFAVEAAVSASFALNI